jgi:hypothetical protein
MAVRVSTITDLIWNLRRAVAAYGFAVKTSATETPGSSPTITADSGAASEAEPNGSLHLRTGGVPEVRVGGAWKALAVADQTFDSGSAGIKADVVAESTAAAGVTIDGLLLKDGSVRPGAIADPGDAGAIPVTSSGYCPLVTGGAETRTLAAPSFIGQELELYLKTDGGDCVVTCATGLNQTGNNTATFGDAGDLLLLRAVESGANIRWRVVANDTVALATV